MLGKVFAFCEMPVNAEVHVVCHVCVLCVCVCVPCVCVCVCHVCVCVYMVFLKIVSVATKICYKQK